MEKPGITPSPSSVSPSARMRMIRARAVNRYGVLLRAHDEDHAAAGVEPFEDLLYYFGVPVVWGDNLHRQVRCARPVAFDGTDLLQTLAAHEGRVRGAHGVGVVVDFETGFGGVDTPEAVSLDVLSQSPGKFHGSVSVFVPDMRHLPQFPFDQLVAEAVVRHTQQFFGRYGPGPGEHGTKTPLVR